jgi:hypothetical protein
MSVIVRRALRAGYDNIEMEEAEVNFLIEYHLLSDTALPRYPYYDNLTDYRDDMAWEFGIRAALKWRAKGMP